MFPNLKNKKFIDIGTNDQVTVIDQFENIAILDNREKVDVKRLLDGNYYDEYVDPESFFDQKNLQIFTDKITESIKSIPTDTLNNMKDDDNSGSAIIHYEDDGEEKRILEEKVRSMSYNNPTDAVRNQLDKFKDLIDTDDDIDIQLPFVGENGSNTSQINSNSTVTQNNTHIIDKSDVAKVDDPMISMFKNIKKNTDFKISIDILDKIPRPDFIEMMEDSYEVSIIEFLSNEFTNKILSDPSYIKDKIKEEINNIVYPKKVTLEKVKAPTKPKAPVKSKIKATKEPLTPKDRHLKEGEVPKNIKQV